MKCTAHGIEQCTNPKCIKEAIFKQYQEEGLKKLSKRKTTFDKEGEAK